MLLLYTTLGCHLCDEAKELLWPLLQKYNLVLHEVDVVDDEVLLTTYGTRIPVVKLKNQTSELGWPFDAESVERYLEKYLALVK